MSMNIVCKEMELPQIGTYESELILSYDVEHKRLDGGWKGVCRRLIWYWKMHHQYDFNRECTNPERQQEINDYYHGLIRQLQECMAAHKVLHFYLV